MNSGSPASNSLPTSPTPRELAAILFRHPRLMAGTTGGVLLVTILFAVFSARYESHFRVLLRRGRIDPVISAQASSLGFARPEITEEELNSEVELLRGRDLLKQVVMAAHLVPQETPDPSPRVERAVRKLAERLEIEALKKSNVIQVSLRDTDPERAARILKALSVAYVNKHTSVQRPTGEVDFFSKQTAESERRLRDSEARLVDFTRTRGVVFAAMERDIALQKLGEAGASYRQIDQDRVETERTVASLREQLKSFPSRSVTLKRWADNPQLLEKLKTHLLELQLKRTELLTRFEPSYRLVGEVDQEIDQTRASITSEALTPVRDETSDKDPNYEWARLELERAEVRLAGLQARQADALAQTSALRTIAQQMQSHSVDQQDLMRAAKANEDAYLLYLHKREEARISDALDQQHILNVAIAEHPEVPALPMHSSFAYLLAAFGLAIAFSVGAAFIAEYFDPTIRTPDEARALLDVSVLAWLPASESCATKPRISRARGSRIVTQ